MNIKDKIQVVFVSVLIAVAISAGLYKVVSNSNKVVDNNGPAIRNPLRMPADDAPIIMAGGSLYIGNNPSFWFTPDTSNPHQLDFSSPMKVSQIDVTYYDSAGNYQDSSTSVTSGQAGSVTMKYCKDATCKARQTDLVTLSWSSANAITLTNNLGARQPFSLVLPNLRLHNHKLWTAIAVTGTVGITAITPVDCTQSDSECNVVVHTCDPTATCTINN